MTDTSSFENYEHELQSLLKQIETSLSTEPPSAYTENLLQQCDDYMKQMSLEARSIADANLKRDLLNKVRQHKAQYQKLRDQSDRQALLVENGLGGGGNTSHQQDLNYARLQANEDSLAQQNETLERAKRTMMETEQVALEITEELGNNRETLMSAHSRIREVSGMTGRARRILNTMAQRAVQQKMLIYAIGGGLGLAFMIIIWRMWS